MKIIKYKYKDCTITVQWNPIINGKWPYGEKDEVEIDKSDFYWYWNNKSPLLQQIDWDDIQPVIREDGKQ